VETTRALAAEGGKQAQLTAPELAVVAGDVFDSSVYTLSATIDSNVAAAVLVEKTRAEAAEQTKQVQLTTPQLAVCAGDPFNSSVYTLSATIDSNVAAAVLVEKTRAEAAEQTKQGVSSHLDAVVLAARTQAQLEKLDATSAIQGQLDALSSGKQALLGSGALDILTGEKYTSAEQTKLADSYTKTEVDTAMNDKLSLSTGGVVSGDILLKKTDGSPCDLELSRRDHNDMNHTFKLSVSYLNINQEGLQISANGQPFVWYDERQRVSIGNNNPSYVFDVTGDGRFTTNLNVDGNLVLGGTISFGGQQYTLPSGDGASGQVLTTDGSGNLSWTNK
jgi:hypothetical protein